MFFIDHVDREILHLLVHLEAKMTISWLRLFTFCGLTMFCLLLGISDNDASSSTNSASSLL